MVMCERDVGFYGETNMDEPRQSGWWGRNWGCLVLAGIFAVVVFFVISVTSRIHPEDGRKKDTIVKQKMLLAAIDAYRKTTGAVPDVAYDPDSSDPNKSDPARQMALLVAKLQGKDRDDPVYKATKPFLGDDPERSTRDGYGNAMLYLKDGGVGGKPVIVSAGPDGKFGYGGKTDGATTNAPVNKQAQKDNIRSDMN
jgi:hypothetical protein